MNSEVIRELIANEIKVSTTSPAPDTNVCQKELFGLKDGENTVAQRRANTPAAIAIDKPASSSDAGSELALASEQT